MMCYVFFLMNWRPPISTRTDTLFPYTTLFRSPQCTIIGIGNEIELARREPVADPDVPDLTALAGKRGAHAERVEHPPARARHRRRAPIETGRQHMIGIGGIEDDRRQTMRIARDPERTAHQPAAQHGGLSL